MGTKEDEIEIIESTASEPTTENAQDKVMADLDSVIAPSADIVSTPNKSISNTVGNVHKTPNISRKRDHQSDTESEGEKISTVKKRRGPKAAINVHVTRPKNKPKTSITKEVNKPQNKTRTNTSKKSTADSNPDMTTMFNAMMQQFTSLRTDLTDRIDLLESNIEHKITQRVSAFIDSKLNSAVENIKTEMTHEVKSTVSTELSEIKSRLDHVEKVNTGQTADNNRELNLIIRNLPESDREKEDVNITVNKVKALLTDGLKLTNIDIAQAQRKHSRNYRKHGVVVLTLTNGIHKSDIMAAKNKLNESERYRDIFIENDIPYEQRVNSANMNTILREIGKSRTLTVHRGRIVNKHHTRGQSSQNDVPPTSRRDYRSHDQQHHRQSNNRRNEESRDWHNVNNQQKHVSSHNNRDRTTNEDHRQFKSPHNDNRRNAYDDRHGSSNRDNHNRFTVLADVHQTENNSTSYNIRGRGGHGNRGRR